MDLARDDMLMRQTRAVKLCFLLLACSWLGCGQPRNQNLSYTSKLWQVYDSRPRFLFWGDRALPKGRLRGLVPRSWGVWVLGPKGSRALVLGDMPRDFLMKDQVYEQVVSCGNNLLALKSSTWMILFKGGFRSIEWAPGTLPLKAITGGQKTVALGSNNWIYEISAEGRVSAITEIETVSNPIIQHAGDTVAVFSGIKARIFTPGKEPFSLKLPGQGQNMKAAILPDGGLAYSAGPTLHLYLQSQGKGRWSRRQMSMYVEGAKSILDVKVFGSTLAVATDKGVALSHSAPYQLWHVLDGRSGLPEGQPLGMTWASRNLWLLYDDKVCRTESVVWQQLGLR